MDKRRHARTAVASVHPLASREVLGGPVQRLPWRFAGRLGRQRWFSANIRFPVRSRAAVVSKSINIIIWYLGGKGEGATWLCAARPAVKNTRVTVARTYVIQ